MSTTDDTSAAAAAGPVERPVRPRVWMDARWPLWDTADSFVEGDEPDTVHAWVPLYDDAAVRELRQECRRLRETLNFIATHFSGDWPERCQSNVLAARYALTSGPDYAQLECERMRRALHEIAEEWAGAECGEPVHAQEAYAIGLAKRMYALAAAALGPNVRAKPPKVGLSE